MGASIFNGDSVKILKDKLKFKSNHTLEKSPDGLLVTDVNGTKSILDENKKKSIWQIFNADNDVIGNWTNTGTGTFTFDSVAPINGTSSYKFVTAAQNDEVKRLFTPVFRNKGKENSLSLQYTMDVLGIEVQIFDTATLTIIEQFPLEVSTSSNTLNIPFILKDTSTTIEVRFINTHLTNTPVLVFDDGELSDNPFVYKNLLITESGFKSGGVFSGTVIGPLGSSTLNSLVSYDSVTGIYTVLKECKLDLNVYTFATLTNRAYATINDGVGNALANNTNDQSNNNTPASSSLNGVFQVGFTFKFDIFNGDSYKIRITATAEATHVITPIKNNIDRVVASGNGGQAVTGNVTDIPFIATVNESGAWNGSQYTVGFDADITISGKIAATTNQYSIFLYKNGILYKSIGEHAFGNESTIKITEKFLEGTILSFRSTANITLNNNTAFHHLEITAKDINSKALAAIPKRRVAKYSYSNVVSVGSVVGIQVVPLDIIEGDVSFSSLNTDQITLSSGTYRFKGSMRSYVSGLVYGIVHNVTDNVILTQGTVSYCTIGSVVTSSIIDSVDILLNKTTVLELRLSASIANSGNGIAQAGELASPSYLTIEKIK